MAKSVAQRTTSGLSLLAVAFTMLASCRAPTPGTNAAPGASNLSFQALAFQRGSAPLLSVARVDEFTVSLAGPDRPEDPTAWEGPLEILHAAAGSTCQADVSLITQVYAAKGASYVVALSYSGSTRYVHFLNEETCKEQWPTMTTYSEAIGLSGNLLTIDPGCECPAKDAPCDCHAGQVYLLHPTQPPEWSEDASFALTFKILGVGFEGRRKVLRPKTPAASLAP